MTLDQWLKRHDACPGERRHRIPKLGGSLRRVERALTGEMSPAVARILATACGGPCRVCRHDLALRGRPGSRQRVAYEQASAVETRHILMRWARARLKLRPVTCPGDTIAQVAAALRTAGVR